MIFSLSVADSAEHGRGQGDPSLSWVGGLANWANSAHSSSLPPDCLFLKKSLERSRSWYLHMAQLIKRCFRHRANQALEPSVLQMLLFCDYNGALSFPSCELWSFSHHNYCHQGRKCYSTGVNVAAAGSMVKSNLLWSENWHRPNPAGWVSGRTRVRRRIPYYQLCDINTCLPSLPSQPFIKTAVAVRFS